MAGLGVSVGVGVRVSVGVGSSVAVAVDVGVLVGMCVGAGVGVGGGVGVGWAGAAQPEMSNKAKIIPPISQRENPMRGNMKALLPCYARESKSCTLNVFYHVRDGYLVAWLLC